MRPEDVQEIERLWHLSDSEFASALGNLYPDFRTQVEADIYRLMKASGREPAPWSTESTWEDLSGRHGVYGGEYAGRVFAVLTQYFGDQISHHHDLLKKVICEDFQYCAKKKSGALSGEGLSVAMAIADALFGAATLIPIPITNVSVYLVKRVLLDKLCNC